MSGRRTAMLGIAAAALALAGTVHAQSTIKIGFVSSLSGPFTPWGIQVRDGMKMAIDEINEKGGVLGRKLEVIERDDRNNPNEGITAFRYMVEREGVVAAGGTISSDVGLAVSRQAEAAHVPYLLDKSGSHEILRRNSRYTFRTCLPAAPESVETLAAMIKERKITRVGAIVADYAWGHSARVAIDEMIKPLPGVQLQMEVAPVPEKDFTPYLRKMQQLDPEMIIALGHPPGTPTITRQAIELGMKGQIIGPWYPTEFMVQRVGESMFGRYADYTCADFEHPAYKALAERFNKTYKRMFEDNSFSGYVIVKMVADAIQRTGSVEPEVIAKAIREGTFDQPGYGWPLSYTEWGEMKGAKPLLYTYEKGDPGAVNAGANWRTKVIFRSPPVQPYVPEQ
ncbi:MAG: ABC transporter substrate-binding protein [Burkholderiaceae bacterium]|nr:ABC transporter substrate-binding protein [Burkholderiaceae bacterium]